MHPQHTDKNPSLRIQSHEQIAHIAAPAWNALVEDKNPFLNHAFLQALETHHCVGEKFGWLPRHITIESGNELIAALPLYEKHNGYGEFVFDHTWADAYRRFGLNYYPKLVAGIPYTPTTGQRLLCRPEAREWAYPLLLQKAQEVTRQTGCSGFHCLFPPESEHRWLDTQGLFTRHDCQFHWYNQEYENFDHFLSRLNHRKRKNIKRERRRVAEQGVRLQILDGHSATEKHWALFTAFYNRNFETKWGLPTLNQHFFQTVADALPDQVVLVLAHLGQRTLAGALLFRSQTVLYGRHWGCLEEIDSLHFEACYYQGIEYAIAHGLAVFEPGAQGEHKLARGFIPTLTRSAHWLSDSRFHPAVRQFCQDERDAVEDYMRQLEDHSPFQQGKSP